jgi:predicted phage terminase large subunit-like protein
MNPNLELAQNSLRHFAPAVYPSFKAPRHLRMLVHELEALERGDHDRLIVTMPPRHGKSLLTSAIFPSWFIGRHPESSIIAASYGQELASDFGRRVKAIVTDLAFRSIFPNVRLLEDSQATHRLGTIQGGLYFAVGAGGALTGRGGDLIVLDDPIKNREEAESDTARRSLQGWFESVLYPRLEPGGRIALIQTRWHEADLCGWLLSEHKSENWRVVNLPALAETDDPLGRAEGEALWPARYPLETLERIREAIGSAAWLSLYQQRPQAAEGGIFKRDWWRSFDPDDQQEPLRITLSLDTAFSAKQSADYSVCETFAECADGYYLLHVWRGRVEFPRLIAIVNELADQWNPHALLIEDAASGQSLIQALRASTILPVIPVKHQSRSKEARAAAASPMVEAGRVFLPREAPWLPAFLDELSSFPNGAHDDQVDALSGFLNWSRLSPIESEDYSDNSDLNALFGR